MAFGKAVVASSLAALAEVGRDGESGLVVHRGQPGPLAEATARPFTSERQ
jgi:hypothetical protein